MALTSGRSTVRVALIDGPIASSLELLREANVHTVGASTSACHVASSAACTHGTFLATMLVGARGLGVPAICPGCTLLVRPIFPELTGRGGPSATPETLALAIRECIAAGARVINLSIAVMETRPRGGKQLSAALDEAIDREVLVVAAAGNHGAVGSSLLTRHPAVLPVVSCDLDGRPTAESNLARSIGERGLLAPGVGFQSMGGDGVLMTLGGTSTAAPWVSGAAALLWSLFPAAPLGEIRRALLDRGGRRRLIPRLLDAFGAYESLFKRGARFMTESNSEPAAPSAPRPAAFISEASGAARLAGCGCSSRPEEISGDTATPPYVYALGRIEARFPSLSIEKEYAQAVARSDSAGKTDSRTLQETLADRDNRYLARSMCWVFSIEGLPTYILKVRDPSDLDLLVSALRPTPRATDADVVIGVRGPLATFEMCNGLIVPVVFVSQIYSFDVDSLIQSIPRPEKLAPDDFATAAEEVFDRIQQMADNAGSTDEHRALNYLALRYSAIYAATALAFAQNASLTSVETRASPLSGTRRVCDVIFTYTNRTTDVAEKQFVRVDVTEEFPFLVSKLGPYFER
jgi:hypothetical protein